MNWSPRSAGRRILQLLSDYRVVVLVLLVCRAATWLVDRALGPSPSRADIDRLGYGLPPLLDGRPWTLLTGMVLTKALTVPVPISSLIGVVLLERVAKHWRTIVVLVGGQTAPARSCNHGWSTLRTG